MTIQEFSLIKIKEFGGIDYVLSELEKLRMLAPRKDVRLLNEARIYYKAIHIIEVDMEADFIVYRDNIVKAMNLFNDVLQKYDAPVARLFMTMITYSFDRVQNIRMIS